MVGLHRKPTEILGEALILVEQGTVLQNDPPDRRQEVKTSSSDVTNPPLGRNTGKVWQVSVKEYTGIYTCSNSHFCHTCLNINNRDDNLCIILVNLVFSSYNVQTNPDFLSEAISPPFQPLFQLYTPVNLTVLPSILKNPIPTNETRLID